MRATSSVSSRNGVTLQSYALRLMPDSLPSLAFVDESSDAQVYVMVAAVVGDPREARTQFRGLRRGRQPRVHWSNENRARRAELCAAITRCDVLLVGSYYRTRRPQRQEHSRRECLLGLLGDLDQFGVSDLTLERRDDSGNRRDRKTIEDARRSEIVRPNLAYRHAAPADEPLLWIADIAAGALRLELSGQDTHYANLFRNVILSVDGR